MLVRFWGTRGSLPAPLNHAAVRAKIREALSSAREQTIGGPEALDEFIDRLPFSVRGTYGGNTSCVELVTGGEEYVVCDMGSGIREFGIRALAKHTPLRPQRYNVFLSHLHWDHIMGFPFFLPAYIPGNVIRIHGCHSVMREALQRQHSSPNFPVDFGSLGAKIEFVQLEPGRAYDIVDGLSVRAFRQNHAADSYGYRFSHQGKTVVYSTDSEHKYEILDETYEFIDHFRDADLLIFDAMYSLADQISVKEDWGHSSNIIAVELAQLSGVKHLAMFHHEPIYDDRMLDQILAETRRYAEIVQPDRKLDVTSAYDGLEIVL